MSVKLRPIAMSQAGNRRDRGDEIAMALREAGGCCGHCVKSRVAG